MPEFLFVSVTLAKAVLVAPFLFKLFSILVYDQYDLESLDDFYILYKSIYCPINEIRLLLIGVESFATYEEYFLTDFELKLSKC